MHTHAPGAHPTYTKRVTRPEAGNGRTIRPDEIERI
jgi:hypothetical protein